MPSAAERRSLYPVAGAVVLATDLVTKTVAERALDRHEVLPVLGDLLQLRLVYNPGAAFGLDLGAYSRWIFLGIAVLAVLLLTRLARGTSPLDRFRLLALGLVAGGATGNLIDRLRSPQGVVDFFDVGLGALRVPTFNVADIGVSAGAVLLVVSFWLEDSRRARAESPPIA